MKRTTLALCSFMLLSSSVMAQKKLNGAAGFQGYGLSPTGYLLEFEYEKYFKEDVSSPLRVDLIYASSDDYEAVSLDVHKGFRKYFSNGILLEQSIGVGLITTFYNNGSIWYYDDYTNVVLHMNKPHLGFMPSATIGFGYDLTRKSAKSNLVWLRPKVYWNLGFRGLNMPYYAIQIGYTHNFKSK